MYNLTRSLIRLSLLPPDSRPEGDLVRQIVSATESDWRESLEICFMHKISQLVYYSLMTYELDSAIPPHPLELLLEKYLQTTITNELFLRSLDTVQGVMTARGLNLTVWKGAVMAEFFYPALGTRQMSDIDLAIPAAEMAEAASVFGSLGFQCVPPSLGFPPPSDDAIEYRDTAGIVSYDVHHRVRLFEGRGRAAPATEEVGPGHCGVRLTVLEPNAMLVHMIVHMDGHRSGEGYPLYWIIDVAFLLRKWGPRLDPERIGKLMPCAEHLETLYRIGRLLDREFGVNIPNWLLNNLRRTTDLTLGELIVFRKMALWGAPWLRGWARLAAHKLGISIRARPFKISNVEIILYIKYIIINSYNHI